jgi:uncharacterized membrane protein YukC
MEKHKMASLGNGKSIPDENRYYDCSDKLEQIEKAVVPLLSISNTLNAINGTLIKIELTFDKIVDKAFYCLKWLGIGVFIIVLVAMGFKEFGQFWGK